MGKRTRGKEQKGKKAKVRMKSCIYIFCEGKTEKIYLQHYENSTYNVQVIPVNTGHTDAVGIVRYAKKYISQHPLELQYGDIGYCVFDSDPGSNPNIEVAFRLIEGMRDKGLDCIFSNPCFEVWFVLHFKDAPYGKTAEQMKREIKEILKKEKGITEYSETVDIYDIISDRLKEAVKRAEVLERKQKQIYRVHSHECNPYTDMFKFVAYMDELKTENEKILKKEDASMQTMLEYKGYHAKIEYDADDKIYVGKVIGITDIVCFHGESMEEAKRMFEQSIENYEERPWEKR